MRNTLLILAFMARSSILAQTPTEFKGHVIGESLDKWLAVNQTPESDYCGKRPDRNVREFCLILSAIRSGEHQELTTDDGVHWIFETGRLWEAKLNVKNDDALGFQGTFDRQVKFLTEVYGDPVRTYSKTSSAKDTAQWNLGDGTRVNAYLTRRGEIMIEVTLNRPEPVKAKRVETNQPNPYK